MRTKRFRHLCNGSSLVTTLLVIVVLTIIVTAFLQSMTAERQTSRSYLNRFRAELAAQTAANVSENLMRDLFRKYSDSATAWAKFPQTQGTAFYFRTLPSSTTGALPKDSGAAIKALFLASGAVPVPLADFGREALVFPKSNDSDTDGFSKTNSTNLNRTDPKVNYPANLHPEAWIGGVYKESGGSGSYVYPETRAKWIDILEDPTRPRNDTWDDARGLPTNGLVARYAFWIEDDSFRVNINTAGATPRGSSTLGAAPVDVDLQGLMAAAGVTDFARTLVDTRQSLPGQKFLTSSQLSFGDASGRGSDGDFDKLKFYVTDNSSALNFSRGGVKRLSLNEVVSDNAAPTAARAAMDRIIAGIGNKYAMPSSPSHKSLSDFGQRFYYTRPGAFNAYAVETTPSYNHADIYMQKLAANIYDYIDTDSQPTIIENDGAFSVRERVRADATSVIGFDPPGNGPGPSDTIAVGKEAVPALQEYAMRFELVSMNPPRRTAAVTQAQYEVKISHYFEFLNPTNRAIKVSDLGANGTQPFLLISNQYGFQSNGGTDIPAGRTLVMPLDQFVDGSGRPLTEFPAGKATVITTDQTPEPKFATLGVATDTYFRPNETLSNNEDFKSKTNLKGTTRDYTSGSPTMFRLLARLGTHGGRAGTTASDYETQMLIGNDYGVIESFSALPDPGSYQISLKYNNNATSPPDKSTLWFRGGSLKGNLNGGSVGVASGDPRSLNEQMSIYRYVAGRTEDITRFLTLNLDGGPPAATTFGSFANTSYLNATQWPDYTPQTSQNLNTGYARVANTKLDSIGRLGDIYDPQREATSAANVLYARGGGRSLRIGQSEKFLNSPTSPLYFGCWDGLQTSVSRNRVAWRLADVFSTNTETANPGVININGAGRDNGAALRALFYQIALTTDPTGTGQTVNMDNLIAAIRQRFPSTGGDSNVAADDPSKDLPFWERGEISEITDNSSSKLPIFSSGTALLGSSADMRRSVDRLREELVRRSIQLVTTKGNVFRAYCVGEAVSTNRDGSLRVLSRQNLKITFAVEPYYRNPLPDDQSFNGVEELASDNETPAKRFRQPDDYHIKVLSVNTL